MLSKKLITVENARRIAQYYIIGMCLAGKEFAHSCWFTDCVIQRAIEKVELQNEVSDGKLISMKFFMTSAQLLIFFS